MLRPSTIRYVLTGGNSHSGGGRELRNALLYLRRYSKFFTGSDSERKACSALRSLELDADFNPGAKSHKDILDKYDLDLVKSTYLRLVKKYHPDSFNPDANRNKFQEITDAYEFLADFYKRREDTDWAKQLESKILEEEVDEEPLISPQHRRYLNLEGVGFGTPSQRRQQYDKWRADKASERVFQFRRDSMLRNTETFAVAKQQKESKYTRKIMTSNMILRMADDMIKESMANGEFDNLPGKGRPLKSSADHNPYVDVHTHKLNSVLISNGYAPEWMSLEREIKNKYKSLKEELHHAYTKYFKTSGSLWNNDVKRFKEQVIEINKRVDKLNMIAPSLKVQMAHYNADIAIEKVLNEARLCTSI